MQGIGRLSSSGETVDTLRDAGSDHVSQRLGCRVGMRLLALLCATMCVAAIFSATASAKTVRKYVSTFGSFRLVTGVAIDQSTEDVYVYDGLGSAIYKYDALGNPVEFGSTGSNKITAPFTSFGSIAVDNSPGPDKGDIYLESSTETVEIYSEAGQKIGEITESPGTPWGPEVCGVAVGSNGAVYLGIYPETVNEYVPGSTVVSDSDYVGSYSGLDGICNVEVDPVGNLFAVTWYAGPIAAYSPSQFGAADAEGAIVDAKGSTLAVDPATEDVFVNEQNQVSVFGPDGKPELEPLEAFAGSGPGAMSIEQESFGIAVNGATNVAYVPDGKANEGVSIFGPPVELPGALTQGASALGAKSATVEGEVDPESLPVEECYFEYGESTSYAAKAPCAESEGEIGAGAGYVKVHAELNGLTSGAHYHYRLVAVDENGETEGDDRSFALALPDLGEEYAANVSATSADLGAGLSASGNPTRYYFEYGTTGSYGSSTPVSEVTEESLLPVLAHINGLLPETVYHYRIVATSAYGTVEGVDQTFITEPQGGPLQLLDGRQWELVSPPNKHGAGILHGALGKNGSIVQAAVSGDAITYVAMNPIEEAPEGNDVPEESQIISRRGPDGIWRSRTLNTPNESVHKLSIGLGLESKLFSPELTLSAIEPHGNTPLAPNATSERSTYVRDEAACEAGTSACFTPVLTREDTAPGAKWDSNPEEAKSQNDFVDATEDIKHIVISAEVPLTEGAAKSGLYEWTEGHLENVSINQAGQSVPGGLGGANANVRGAISSDGTKLFWCEEQRYVGCAQLLMRDTATQETLRIDPATSTSRGFQIATEDGSRVFYTVEEPGEFGKQLWECTIVEVAGKAACERSEVAPEAEGDVIGISPSGSTVYFVSKSDLATGAQPGGENLYVSDLEGEHWVARFIATLAPERFGSNEGDWHDWGGDGLTAMTARVSPNGRYLAFISELSLTGYDNHDAVSGARDDEVFLYDSQTGKLACVSCDASGARPAGRYIGSEEGLINEHFVYDSQWVAADLPSWEEAGSNRTVHQPRFLDDEGRMFFTSMVPLVPQDTNGEADVYEYEPDGVGSCTTAGGCVQLVSSGTSSEPSLFLEASESGDDVFFITTAQLTLQDRDTEYDVYDARVCSESDPCTPAAVSPPPCSSGEGCKPAQTPQPTIYGAPASETFSGAANPPRSSGKSSRSSKASSGKRASKRRLQRALKKCKRRDARKRAMKRRCEAQARKRFGRSAKHKTRTSARDARPAKVQASENGRGR